MNNRYLHIARLVGAQTSILPAGDAVGLLEYTKVGWQGCGLTKYYTGDNLFEAKPPS